MSWSERITELFEARPLPTGVAGRPQFHQAAEAARLAEVEAVLGAALPESLKSLLKETDGVMDMLSIDRGPWFESMWLLWACEELIEQNLHFRRSRGEWPGGRDFGSLVFFAGAGTDGILFAFTVEAGVCSPRVTAWRPISDEVEEIASSLDEFLRGWLTGSITV